MIASPTATSAAATTNTNTTKTLPRSSGMPPRRENATSARFVALSMSSTHMRMTTALRRTSTPVTPMKNSTAETATNAPSGIIRPLVARLSFVFPLDQDDRADHRGEEQHRRDLEREREVAEHARRERPEVRALRAGGAVAEREREDRDGNGDRRDEQRGKRRLLLEEERVRTVALRREHHAVEDEDRDRADVDEDLEHRDRLGAEQQEHPGVAQERERHEQRRSGDAVEQDDAGPRPDHADDEQGEERRFDHATACSRAARRARRLTRRRRWRNGIDAANTNRRIQFAIATGTSEVGKASTRIAVTRRFTRVTGMRNFQQNDISWSMRKRGSVARIHMKTRTKKYVFSVNHSTPSAGPRSGCMSVKGPCPPPNQSVV